MVRIRTNVATHRRKKRVLNRAKGYFAQKSKRYRQAKRTLIKAMTYSYRDRKARKGEFRELWTIRINAACRESGIAYSRFIKGLTAAKIEINRKMLAELAVSAPDVFKKLVEVAQNQNGAVRPAPKAAKVS